ncbi:uncharacterized protein LOC144577185 [Callithrix jacchus]
MALKRQDSEAEGKLRLLRAVATLPCPSPGTARARDRMTNCEALGPGFRGKPAASAHISTALAKARSGTIFQLVPSSRGGRRVSGRRRGRRGRGPGRRRPHRRLARGRVRGTRGCPAALRPAPGSRPLARPATPGSARLLPPPPAPRRPLLGLGAAAGAPLTRREGIYVADLVTDYGREEVETPSPTAAQLRRRRPAIRRWRRPHVVPTSALMRQPQPPHRARTKSNAAADGTASSRSASPSPTPGLPPEGRPAEKSRLELRPLPAASGSAAPQSNNAMERGRGGGQERVRGRGLGVGRRKARGRGQEEALVWGWGGRQGPGRGWKPEAALTTPRVRRKSNDLSVRLTVVAGDSGSRGCFLPKAANPKPR